MKRTKGNATIQYSIIIALVILVLIPVFFIFGGTITKSFTDFYNCLQNKENLNPSVASNNSNSSSNTINNNSTSTSNDVSGSYPATSTTPQVNCDKGICTINYGDFVLKGIPDNFGGFIEAQGTSGGLDEIAGMLEKIIQQLDENNSYENGIIQYLENMIQLIGTDLKGTSDKNFQYAAQIEIYECMAGGSCENMTDAGTSPKAYVHKRLPYMTPLRLPYNPEYGSSALVEMQKTFTSTQKDAEIDAYFDQIKNIAQGASMVNKKDYSDLVAIIGSLKDKAHQIKKDFAEEIGTTGTGSLTDPTTVNLESVKNNIASKNEDLTGYIMCKASNINCK